MSAPLVLIAFIALASTAGRTFLLRASWVQTSPRWGIWAWQTLTVAIASAIVPLKDLPARFAKLAHDRDHLIKVIVTP